MTDFFWAPPCKKLSSMIRPSDEKHLPSRVFDIANWGLICHAGCVDGYPPGKQHIPTYGSEENHRAPAIFTGEYIWI